MFDIVRNWCTQSFDIGPFPMRWDYLQWALFCCKHECHAYLHGDVVRAAHGVRRTATQHVRGYHSHELPSFTISTCLCPLTISIGRTNGIVHTQLSVQPKEY